MSKLLNASFWRLKKNKIFWGVIIITLIIACVMIITRYNDEIRYAEFNMQPKTIDSLYITFINIVGFLIATFTSLFVGTEYSDGTIRNKIIVGHSRKNIYLANLIVSIVVGIILEVLYLLIISIIGIPLFGSIQMPIEDFFFVILDMIMVIIVFSSIFNFISLLCSNITISTVGCLLLILVMYVIVMSISGIANSEKYLKNQIVDEQGNERIELTFNEDYPGDLLKEICRNIVRIIPTGQTIELSSTSIEYEEIKIFPLYSFGLFVVINSLGIYLFNRKELR